MNNKQKILIVDDSEMNRSILADILEDKYDIIETEDGVEGVAAIQKYGTEISVVLLDVVMPRMDGFGVLDLMNQHHWIDEIPVIMISSENPVIFNSSTNDNAVMLMMQGASLVPSASNENSLTSLKFNSTSSENQYPENSNSALYRFPVMVLVVVFDVI